MLPRPSKLRALRLSTGYRQSPVLRNTLQCRFASTEPPKLVGPMDNAFNRERLAVKHHAAQSADLWRKLCIYVVVPALIIGGLNAKNLWDEHWEHWEHMPPLEERVQYPYMNIRTKAYPWGDGDKPQYESLWESYPGHSLQRHLLGADCWNPKVNYHRKDE
ncbi:MAG: Cytochrome c oxidase subunit 6A, mitochondrial [Alectoria sarmentosa]|nr:MAG: Cytochrome c oxidase subunit 6A, mitochondrial [Alectoria sarmentosa]